MPHCVLILNCEYLCIKAIDYYKTLSSAVQNKFLGINDNTVKMEKRFLHVFWHIYVFIVRLFLCVLFLRTEMFWALVARLHVSATLEIHCFIF